MLTFQNILMYMGLAVIPPLILGFLNNSFKKVGIIFLILGGIYALLPMMPIANFLLCKFYLHPELYGPTNWNSIVILAIEFSMVSLVITDALVLGDSLAKTPLKNILSLILTLLLCSGIFYAMDGFNYTSNHVHVVLEDIMNIR